MLFVSVEKFSQEDFSGSYNEVQLPLMIAQNLALFDVFHVLVGLIPSNLIATAAQVSSRLIVLWYCSQCF